MPALRPASRRVLAIYNLAFPFVFLALLPGALLRMWRRGKFRARFGERLGHYDAALAWPAESRRPVWIQSISVGETLLALKLAKELRAQDSEVRVLLSVVTVTGFAVAQEQAAEWLQPIYQPLDLRGCVRRALDTLRPERLVIVEGGMWPNLLAECVQRGIPAGLASARLSPRSARRFQRFRRWVAPLFGLLDYVTVSDAEDVARWRQLGVAPERIVLTGGVKFDQQTSAARPPRTEEFRALLAAAGYSGAGPIVVAGSTHAGEERLLAELARRLRQEHPELLLIITPRHVERAAAIERELLVLRVPVARRSALAPGSLGNGAVLLVDTTGELRDWYTLATVVFVGKSLTAEGGQNPGEPALLGKPVVFGPHMENFAALVTRLLSEQAAVQVRDVEELGTVMARLLGDADERAGLSARGPAALEAHQGATARTVRVILQGAEAQA